MSNLLTWNLLKAPPATALRKIGAGRLSGKTDINPMWRYKAMTEVFGPCGIGWKFTVDRQWTEPGPEGQVFAFVNVSLFVKTDVSGWSEAIPGSGGSMLVDKESKGLHASDEAFKMATTDALSVAMKMLGVAAEVYMGNWDGSKYINQDAPKKAPEGPAKEGQSPPAEAPRDDVPEPTGGPDFEDKAVIAALKKKLSAKMVGLSNLEKRDMFNFVIGKEVTSTRLCTFLNEYELYKAQYDKAKEAA